MSEAEPVTGEKISSAQEKPQARTEHVVFHRPDSAPHLEVATIINNQRLWKVYHERFCFCLPEKRVMSEWKYLGKKWDFPGGSVGSVMPGHLQQATKATPFANFHAIFLDPEYVYRVFEQNFVNPGLMHQNDPFSKSPKLIAKYEDLVKKAYQDDSQLSTETAIQDFLEQTLEDRVFALEKKLGADDDSKRRLFIIRDYIHEHWNENFGLELLSTISGLNSFYLNRAFKKVFGLPPYAYQLRLRVERTRALLLEGASYADIAFQCGFSDQSHMNRIFKREMGVLPSEYLEGSFRDSKKKIILT